MTTFFDLTEHRKTIQAQEIRLAEDLVVVPTHPSNEDELANQHRQLEATKLARKVESLQKQVDKHSEAGEDEQAEAAVKEAHTAINESVDLLLKTALTMMADPDTGKKPTLAKLRGAVHNQAEASAVISVLHEALSLDPQTARREKATTR